MRWPRADLEEKQEPRAATSGSAERRAEGMWHDVTRKSLTEAAIEKRTLTRKSLNVGFVPEAVIRASAGQCVFGCDEVVIVQYGAMPVGENHLRWIGR